MEFMVFGNEHNPLFLFYHASCSHWSWYQDAIEKLTEQFFVIVPILDGYNGDYSSDFSSVESTATETTAYLLEHGHKEIDFVYGLSMGGGMVLYMLAQNQVSVKNAVVDGGITPYNLPRIATFLIAVRDYLGIKLLRKSPALIKMAFPPDRWLLSTQTEEAYRDMQGFLKTMSNKTIWNTFYSANNYCMPLSFPRLDTPIEYWYGSREKKARAWDIQYIERMLPEAKIRQFDDMEHGELVMMKPDAFVAEIKRISLTKRKSDNWQ